VKLLGADGLRVDILAPGPVLGEVIAQPELQWRARAIPAYDYLLEEPQAAVTLAVILVEQQNGSPRESFERAPQDANGRAFAAAADRDPAGAASTGVGRVS
jgi:hypothetical protein